MAYTSGDVLIRTVMTRESGLPQDVVINDFAFRFSIPTSDAAVSSIMASVDDFYNGITGGGNPISDYIGESVDRGATHEMQAYHIVSGPLGSPFYTEAWLGPAAPTSADSNLPGEVAGVLSFHALLTGVLEESGATRPRARRRGRVYVGPLTFDAIEYDTPDPELSAAFRLAMQQAGSRLISNTADPGGAPWSVWSRADETLRTIVGGWTDNAPDTQRRRGFETTARATWS